MSKFPLYLRMAMSVLLVVTVTTSCVTGSKQCKSSTMYVSVRDGFIGTNAFPTPIEGLRELGVTAVEVTLGRESGVRAD